MGLGSNLGDRLSHLRLGVKGLDTVLEELRCSPVYASEAQDVDDGPQPEYLNAVVVGRTNLTPAELLEEARGIEVEAGRERPYPRAPRSLDVDILLYGERQVNQEGLRIPHPEWKRRAFVLAPLGRVAPDWRDPETGVSVRELWTALAPDLPAVRRVAAAAVLAP